METSELWDNCRAWPQWTMEYIAAVRNLDAEAAKELKICLESSVAWIEEFDAHELFAPFTLVRSEPFIMDGSSYVSAHAAAYAAATGLLQLMEQAKEGKLPADNVGPVLQRLYDAASMLPGAMEHERMRVDLARVEKMAEKEPETETETGKFSSMRSKDLMAFVEKLRQEHGKGKSDIEIARDFVGNMKDTTIDPANLLRSAQNHKERWK